MGDTDTERGYACVGAEDKWESLFYGNKKLLLKKCLKNSGDNILNYFN